MVASGDIRPRRVGIVGTSYCGSTLLGSMLSLSAGLEPVGEIDYLIRWRETGMAHAPACNRCGPKCQVWTQEVRERRLHDVKLYSFVESLFPEAKTVAQSLKYPHLYNRFGKPDVAILMVRHPSANAYSASKHSGVYELFYYASWIKFYTKAKNWIQNIPERMIICYEDLMDTPVIRTNKMLTKLGHQGVTRIPPPSAFTDHQFGGNNGMRKHTKVTKDVRWKKSNMAQAPLQALQLYESLRKEGI